MADQQKREMIEKVERIKKKGKIVKTDLVNLGLVDNDA